MSIVLIIGGGAAGMAAAVAAAGCGHEVHLYEKNEKPGKKLFITGKGRCNVTNACDMDSLMKNVVTNPRFLYSSFHGFTNQDIMDLLERNGCPLKTERGNRVFPVSDKSSDVISALVRQMKELGVKLHLNTAVKGLWISEGRCRGIVLKESSAWKESSALRESSALKESSAWKESSALKKPLGSRKTSEARAAVGREKTVAGDAVIVATGGLSYPSTGSTGDGYRFAEACGHTVTELRPALVPMNALEEDVKQLQGLSLRNVEAAVLDGEKELFREFGELLFTHFGVSGPVILSASSFVAGILKKRSLTLSINLKPALTHEQLDARILRDFSAFSNKQLKNSLDRLFPAKLIPVMIARSGISPDKLVHEITREERQRLLELTEDFRVTLTGLRDYNEAVITQGGVCVKEINPATMESKKVPGLYFAGEVLDLDGVTGGFNLQIAWSTGWAAGENIPWN